MVQKYLTFRVSIANILHAIKCKFAVQAKRAWTICCFVSCGRSLYRWKVTVARPRIGGVGPNLLYSADEVWRFVAARLKYRSACYSSSKLQWSGGILRCLNGMDCCLLFPVVSVRLLMVSEHRWLTLVTLSLN